MWIRSQDKHNLVNIINTSVIYIHSVEINVYNMKSYSMLAHTENKKKYEIMADERWILGVYDTEERALEVLNDIQKDIETCTHQEHYNYRYLDSEHFLDIKRTSQTVFQMPEK